MIEIRGLFIIYKPDGNILNILVRTPGDPLLKTHFYNLLPTTTRLDILSLLADYYNIHIYNIIIPAHVSFSSMGLHK